MNLRGLHRFLPRKTGSHGSSGGWVLKISAHTVELTVHTATAVKHFRLGHMARKMEY